MGWFERLQDNREGAAATVARPARQLAFRMTRNPDEKHGALLVFERPGTMESAILWSCACASHVECCAILSAAEQDPGKLEFWGRLVLAMGKAALDPIVNAIAATARAAVIEKARLRREKAAARNKIILYIRERDKRYFLDLERASERSPEWSISFAGRSERDRMCDWLRWQQTHYSGYLAYAAANGAYALEKRLIIEMFDTEARLKKNGRVTGGLRPLRMWRGE